jgi:hypothetical protein
LIGYLHANPAVTAQIVANIGLRSLTRMQGENFVAPGHYAEIANSSELPAAAVHLAWLAIGDQQGHNQYLQRLEYEEAGVPRKTKHFKLIDMGQMFGNSNWSVSTVANVHTAYQLPTHLVSQLTKTNLTPVIQLLTQVSDDLIRECFQDCPASWGVSEEDKVAGAEYAIAAQKTISSIIFGGNPAIGA